MVTHSKDTIEYNEIKKIYKRVRGTPITAERMSKIKSATGAIRVFAGGATEIRANVSDLPNANIISDPVVIVQSRGVIDFIYCNYIAMSLVHLKMRCGAIRHLIYMQ